MTAAPSRVGICGAGRIAPFHAEGFVRAGAKVVAIADPSADAAAAIASDYGAAVYPSLEAMLGGADCEIICIATPHHLHTVQIEEALKAGRHVFTDKPLALTLAEGRALVELARQSGQRLGVNHNLLFHPSVIKARSVIRSGDIGAPVSATAWSTGWLDLRPNDFRKDRSQTGGGAWTDAGPHLVYVLADLVGPFSDLTAMPSHASSRLGGEDTVVAIGRFEMGQVASMRISYSYRAPGSDLAWPAGWSQGMEINGTEGAVRLSVSPTGRVKTWRVGEAGWTNRLEGADFAESFNGAIADFLNSRTNPGEVDSSAESAVRILEWMTHAIGWAAEHLPKA